MSLKKKISFYIYNTGGEDSSVSLVTRLLAGQSRVESQQGQEIFFFPELLGSPSLLFSGHKISCLGVKRPEHEADHSPQSSVKVKSKWRYTSNPLLT
jgi:hypothetical protein